MVRLRASRDRGRRARAAAIVLIAALASAAAAQRASSAGPCPAQLAGALSNPPAYHFGYQSWVQPRGGEYRFTHCVRNLGRRGLFVDWRDAALVSFVPPGETAYSVLPRPAASGRKRLSPLFYGARPTRTDVQTVLPIAALPPPASERHALWTPPPPVRLAASAQWEAPRLRETRSFGRLFVPSAAAQQGVAREEIDRRALIERLEARPELLQLFLMDFTNSEDPGPDGARTISWTCRYRTGREERGGERAALRIRFADPAFHRAMFLTDAAIAVRDGRRLEYRASTQLSPGRRATRAVTRLQIFLADGRTLIGAMPVEYSRPA